MSTFSEAAVAPVGRVGYWGEYDDGVSYRPRPRGYGYPLYGYDEGYARRATGMDRAATTSRAAMSGTTTTARPPRIT